MNAIYMYTAQISDGLTIRETLEQSVQFCISGHSVDLARLQNSWGPEKFVSFTSLLIRNCYRYYLYIYLCTCMYLWVCYGFCTTHLHLYHLCCYLFVVRRTHTLRNRSLYSFNDFIWSLQNQPVALDHNFHRTPKISFRICSTVQLSFFL